MKNNFDVVTSAKQGQCLLLQSGKLHDACQFVKRSAGAELNVAMSLLV